MSRICLASDSRQGAFKRLHTGRCTECRAAIGGGAIREFARLFEGHLFDETREQRAEPSVAGAGGIDNFDWIRGNESGCRSIIEQAALRVELDADDASRRHVLAQRGHHRGWLVLSSESRGFGATGRE